MKREIEHSFIDWKARSRRKPLIVRGARQVGKTHSIQEFGRVHFKNLVSLDFERQQTLHRIFSSDLDASSIIQQIEAYVGQRIIPGETLLFFDEIQECSRALLALRYFHEQMPDLHVVAAGSLLEFAMKDISFPVGRVEFLWLYPLSFSEFLKNTGEEIIDSRRPFLKDTISLPEALHLKLMENIRRYFIVGGMPEAVSIWIETHSYIETARIHRELVQAYRQDFAKYAGRTDRDCLDHIMDAVPARVGEQIKYAPLYPEKRIETIKHTLNILEQALVLRRVRSTSAMGLPLGAGVSDKVFKCIFIDIGLMGSMCGLDAGSILKESDLMNTYRGSLAEQFIGQELLAMRGGSEDGKLYYWARDSRSSSAEVDYVMADGPAIIPIEVKSGSAGRLKSIHLFLEEHPGSPQGLVFNSSALKEMPEQRLKFMPLYTVLR